MVRDPQPSHSGREMIADRWSNRAYKTGNLRGRDPAHQRESTATLTVYLALVR